MNSESAPLIKARGLCKNYKRPQRFRHRVAGWLGLRSLDAKHVLGPLDLDLGAGGSLGLLGRNGSGKSSLLKMLAGVSRPSSGDLQVSGHVAAVLELGTGFHPHFSGRDNARLQAALHGLDRHACERLLPGIEAFAGLGQAIHEPLRTYSSGMVARLAFSAAMAVEADLLLVDEALAVGDAGFQARCLQRFQSQLSRGGALVVATHNPDLLGTLCQEVLVLEDGHCAFRGPADEAAAFYAELLVKDPR